MAITAALVCPSCATAGHETSADQAGLADALIPVLKLWLTSRRWFRHEAGCLQTLRVLRSAVLHQDDGTALLHFLLAADHAGGGSHPYQVLLGLRRSWPPHLPAVSFGRCRGGRWDGWWMYDAATDPAMMRSLIHSTAHPDRPSTPRLTLVGGVSAELVEQLDARALNVEQSNTSVVYGDRFLLKFFRSPRPGANREATALEALGVQRCTRVAKLAGVLRTQDYDRTSTVLGVVTDFLANEGDGWEHGVAHAEQYLAAPRPIMYGADGFYARAHAMGAAVAEVHACLARAFGVWPLMVDEVREHAAGMRERLEEAAERVPELRRHVPDLRDLYARYVRTVERGRVLPAQHVHGDLHLGQLLSTADGWKVIDFEGEPDAVPAASGGSGALRSAATDVAGMFRSFDYAARQAVARIEGGAEGSEGGSAAGPYRALRLSRAENWAECNRQAFAAGYVAAGGDDPFREPEMLKALEADKAVYECVYEARHRPEWLHIPLTAVAALARPAPSLSLV